MSHIHTSQIVCFTTAVFTALTITACSGSDISFYFQSPEEQSAILYDSPRFWDNAVPVDEANGLYQIENVAFEGKPYNSISNFGNNILMVGQGIYATTIVESLTEPDPEYEYSFEVYDPWQNKVVAKLSHEEIKCDSYQVLSDKLFLYDSEENKINIYDTKLKLEDTLDCPEDGIASYYSGPESDLVFHVEDGQLLVYSITDQTATEIDNNMYDFSFQAVSDDGSTYLLSGVDKNTLQEVITAFDSETNQSLTYLQGDNFSMSDISSTAFVSQIDSDNKIWVYHSFEGDNKYFSLSNINSLRLLQGDTMLIHSEDNITQNDTEHEVSYYLYSISNGVVSSFTFNCGILNQPDTQVLSPDYAYLPEANSVVFLVYTSECMPKLILWKLDESINASGFKLNSYSSINKVEAAIAEGKANSVDSSRSIVSEYPADFGSDITLIDNPNAYEWGDLSEINHKATELEEKYNIEIYLGPEVPSSLDYYNLKQNDDYDALSESLSTLEHIFDCYPDNFFTQLCFGTNEGIRLYLTGDITGNYDGTIAEASGFVTNINSHIVIVLDANYSWDWDYTVNHEIAHLIDRRLDFLAYFDEDCVYSYETWCSYNPEDFSYLESYENYENNPSYTQNSKYFIDAYGTTYSTEDRAELFGTVMDDSISGITENSLFAPGTVLYDKMVYYCECIRDGFNSEDWPEELPWEEFYK